MAAQDDPLASLRVAIDTVDDEILALLNRRATFVQQVGEAKEKAGGVFYRPGRERAIVDRLQGANRGPFPEAGIRPVFQEVISACLSLEKGVRVAYLGPEGTFTHQAVNRHFGTSALSVPCRSIPAVFEEVERGQADFGVVPVENSTEGVVTHTLDTFTETQLRISAEIVVTVDLCLLARAGVSEGQIERVYSHPQPLAQSRSWLQANLPQATLVECSSTTDAAARAARDGAGAAIAAELAARLHRLEILRRQLQDVRDNVTRFFVIGAESAAADGASREFKTTLLLSLPDSAGALLQVLEPLRDNGINLTKIESRPSRQKKWDYVFFVDLDGHAEDANVARTLKELSEVCELFEVLGSYRKADER